VKYFARNGSNCACPTQLLDLPVRRRPARLIPAMMPTMIHNRKEKFPILLIWRTRGKNGLLFILCLTYAALLKASFVPLPDRFVASLCSQIVPAALPHSRPARSIPMMSTLTQIDMKEKIPKRKCSTISTRHLAQVHRLAMVLTDKNFVVCINVFVL
jgi:hypothetical protein